MLLKQQRDQNHFCLLHNDLVKNHQREMHGFDTVYRAIAVILCRLIFGPHPKFDIF